MALNAANVTIGLGLAGLSGVLGGMGRVNSALGGVARGTLGGFGLAALAGGAVAAGAAVGGLGVAIGKTGTDFLALQEQALVAFTTMLGSGQKAQAFFGQLQQFAATTPFELPGILEASQHLLAFGFQAKDIVPDLTAIGNAVSATGGGQAGLDRVILALGQMKAKGKVQGDEMLQLTENNINAWQYLAAFLGTDVPTAMKRVTKGLVTGDQGVQAILAGLNKDPKFAGMMAAQANTFTGLVSNMHDYWNMFAAAVMRPIFDKALKPGLQWLTTWLSGPGLALGTRIGVALGDGLSRAGRAVQGLRGQFQAFRAALGADALGGGRLAALAAGFLRVRAAITQHIIPAVKLLWNTFAGGASGRIGGWIGKVFDGDVSIFEKVARGFQLGVDAVVTFKQALAGDWFKNGSGNAFIDTIGRIGLALGDLKTTFDQGGFGAAFGKLWSDYLQPALTSAWTNLQGWITGTAIPEVRGWGGQLAAAFGHLWANVTMDPAQNLNKAGAGGGVGLLGLFGGWLTALNGWAVATALPVVEREITSLITAADAWIAGTGYPLLKAAAGKLWAAFTDELTGKPAAALPIEDLAGNIIPQKGGTGDIFSTALNDAMDGLGNWAAGPGHQALMAVAGDLGTFFKTQLQLAFVDNGTGIGGVAAWLNSTSDTISAWLDTTAGPLFARVGAALGFAFREGLKGIIPSWAWGAFGLAGQTGGPPGAGQGGKPSDYAGPGNDPGHYLGTDGQLHPYAPGAAGGFQIPDPNNLPKGGNSLTGQAPILLSVTVINQSPLTTGDVLDALAQQLADGVMGAMTTALGGNGLVTA